MYIAIYKAILCVKCIHTHTHTCTQRIHSIIYMHLYELDFLTAHHYKVTNAKQLVLHVLYARS